MELQLRRRWRHLNFRFGSNVSRWETFELNVSGERVRQLARAGLAASCESRAAAVAFAPSSVSPPNTELLRLPRVQTHAHKGR